MELIQYAPRIDSVFRTPLLFVPPWINKYYILDLQPENSLFQWLIGQGHTVFVISWANPCERHAHKGFEHYLLEGPLQAIDVVRRITGENEINLGGFCIGGILAVCALAYLWAGGDVPVKSATLLATMVDLTAVGDAAVFIDEAQLVNIERHTKRTGFLEGYHMKDMFSMMRENDLIWSYVINNYLLGRPPPAFDILHWNADSTRLPARMLTDFLRGIYMENSLVRPGHLRLAGREIDLRSITTPCYFLSTIEDHIAPWKATYPATQILSGPTAFVLAGSGHIVGVINPPTKKKYGYWQARPLSRFCGPIAQAGRATRRILVAALRKLARGLRRPNGCSASGGQQRVPAASRLVEQVLTERCSGNLGNVLMLSEREHLISRQSAQRKAIFERDHGASSPEPAPCHPSLESIICLRDRLADANHDCALHEAKADSTPHRTLQER